MAENTKAKTPAGENQEPAANKPARQKAEKTNSGKKPNFIVRGARKVKKVMSEHPIVTAAVSGFAGAGLTAGVGIIGKKAIDRRHQKACYQQQEGYENDLDPNN